MRLINLTQHPATKEQMEAGVIEPANKDKIRKLLTFNELPTKEELRTRAKALVDHIIVYEKGTFDAAMIGGAPFFMSVLEDALRRMGIIPLYAFSKREVVEKTLPSGEVVKTQVFKHLGFVESYF